MEVDVAGEPDAGSRRDMPGDRQHTNAPVLELDGPEAVEPLLVGVLEETKGIPESEGILGTDFGSELRRSAKADVLEI